MSSRTTLSIEIGDDIAEKLDRLARATGRSKDSLAADALAAYLDREIEIVNGILLGLEDVEADRTVSHDEAMAELDSILKI